MNICGNVSLHYRSELTACFVCGEDAWLIFYFDMPFVEEYETWPKDRWLLRETHCFNSPKPAFKKHLVLATCSAHREYPYLLVLR